MKVIGGEIYFIEWPEQMLLAQRDGKLIALDMPARFNRKIGKYAHAKIEPLHRCELVFSNREDGPHLIIKQNEIGRNVADISREALFELVATLQIRTGKAIDIATLFDRNEISYCRAWEFLEGKRRIAESVHRLAVACGLAT
jgi:hypothetical protein